jgi:hypothetical protein
MCNEAEEFDVGSTAAIFADQNPHDLRLQLSD